MSSSSEKYSSPLFWTGLVNLVQQLDCFLFAILTFAISDQIVQVTVYNELVIPTKERWNSTNKEIEGGIHQAKTM